MITSTTVLIGLLCVLPLIVLRANGKFIYFAVLSLIAVVAHGIYFFGPNVLYLLLITYVVSTAAELTSLKTPIYCFGVKYRYALNHPVFSSRVRLLGVYPLEVSLTWVIFKYLSYAMTMLIVSAFALPLLWKILLVPLLLVSIDFILDPFSVLIRKLWHWEKGSFYFGIPIRNFIAWYLVGLLSTILFVLIDPGKPLAFDYLLIFPVVYYGTVLSYIPKLLAINKRNALAGAVPAAVWTILGIVSLVLLFMRRSF